MTPEDVGRDPGSALTMERQAPGYPVPTSAAVSAVMRGNRRADTRPERLVRSMLHTLGYRFRKDHRLDVTGVRVRPDIVFTRLRLAVFVDGCFWHRCPAHGTSPRSNSDYWRPKLERNVARDERVDRALRASGWTVLRLWEHEAPEEAVRRIVAALGGQPDVGEPPSAERDGP